jgi:hypothetical protein
MSLLAKPINTATAKTYQHSDSERQRQRNQSTRIEQMSKISRIQRGMQAQARPDKSIID